MIITSRTLLRDSTASTWSGMSVVFNSSAVFSRTRATSTATLPTPMTIAVWAVSVNLSRAVSGCPLYQETNSVAEKLPGRSLPADSQPPVNRSAVRHREDVHVAGADLHDEQAVQAPEADGAVHVTKSVASIVAAYACRNCRQVVSVCRFGVGGLGVA